MNGKLIIHCDNIKDNEEREVCHFLYVAWMDKTVPDNVFCLMNLREKVMTLADKKSKKTIVVHCRLVKEI